MSQHYGTMVESRKRHRSPDSSEEYPCKNNCQHHIHLLLESESPLPTDEDSESVHSVQFAETASPKDTSDTSWTSDSKTMDIEEYEVASLHSDEKLLSNCDSSCSDDILVATATAATLLATTDLPLSDEEALWADSSDMESDCTTDSEVPRADYWECTRCKCKCTPLFRLCQKCFQLRKGYFMERPKRVHPRRRKRRCVDGAAEPRTTSSSTGTLSQLPSLPSTSSQLSPTRSSSEPMLLLDMGDSGISLPNGGSFQSQTSVIAVTEAARSVKGGGGDERGGANSRTHELCFMCVERPRTGGFVHNKTVHVLCCYECGLRVWNKTKVCPLCNRPPKTLARVIYG